MKRLAPLLVLLAAPLASAQFAATLGPDQITLDEAMPVIEHRDARHYIGRPCIVQGKVLRASRYQDRIIFLNFSEDRQQGFTAVVRKENFSAFPEPPEVAYDGKTVRLRGWVFDYQGKPEIQLTSPAQIEVLEAAAPVPPRKAAAAERTFDGTLKIATYNVLNLFDSVDDPYLMDETTPPTPRAQLERLAASIRKLDADILALQEVENRGYLQRFVDTFLADMGYREVVFYEGNYLRAVDVCLLSRVPIGPVTSYRHVDLPGESGHTVRFARDLLRVTVLPPGAPAFDVFVVHLKSKSQGEEHSLPFRKAECRYIRKLFDDILKDDPKARFLILGDFNDVYDSEPLTLLRGDGPTALKTFFDELPEDNRVTYNQEPFLSMIDFIFCSPAMAETYVKNSYSITPGKPDDSGSDHNPVSAKFKLK